MKCLVLAGGSGDRLWPLSRKNNPKQFAALKDGHSLFQETIVRNIPFCTEFWVVTSRGCRDVATAQLQVFQQLKVRVFCEAEPRKTAPALALACLLARPEEELLVVSTDHLIEGDYKQSIVEARRLAAEGQLVCLGVEPRNREADCGFLREEADGRLAYSHPESPAAAADLAAEGWCWDTGILLGRAGEFLTELRRFSPDLMRAMARCADTLPPEEGVLTEVPPYSRWNVPAVGIGPALTRHSAKMRLLKADFTWQRLVDLPALRRYYGGDVGPGLQQNCRDVSILNFAPGKLVVGSDLEDLLIVNTADAVYVAPRDKAGKIKEIVRGDEEYRRFFDDSPVDYVPWGLRERLNAGPDYLVRRLTVLPGRSLTERELAPGACRRWTFLSGTAVVTQNGVERTCSRGDCVELDPGTDCLLQNKGEENLVFVDVFMGDISKKTADVPDGSVQALPMLDHGGEESEPIVALEPAFMDNLWGGTVLRDVYGKNTDKTPVAESWELSAHPAGQSRVAGGRFAGLPFDAYLTRIGKSAWGWKCQSMDRFPLLVKFIDAARDLSIQVHPGDDYALHNENEYGKNEMWYILDAAPDACLYCGFSRPITRAEIRSRIRCGTLMEVMNRVPVRKGQVAFIPSGTVHAIGAGILLCEVQQSSNVTYRLYDYNRPDKDGKLRPLHLRQALEVLDPELKGQANGGTPAPDGEGEILCECKYFTVCRVEVRGSATLHTDDSSFTALVALEGEGTLLCGETRLPFAPLRSFFLPAGNRTVQVTGNGTLLKVHV